MVHVSLPMENHCIDLSSDGETNRKDVAESNNFGPVNYFSTKKKKEPKNSTVLNSPRRRP